MEFLKAMHSEHCVKPGYDYEFTTGNYSVKTSPQKEWKIVMKIEKCPEADMKDHSGKVVRTIPLIEDLQAKHMTTHAGLIEEELIAVVLYTGPMVNTWLYRMHLQTIACTCKLSHALVNKS